MLEAKWDVLLINKVEAQQIMLYLHGPVTETQSGLFSYYFNRQSELEKTASINDPASIQSQYSLLKHSLEPKQEFKVDSSQGKILRKFLNRAQCYQVSPHEHAEWFIWQLANIDIRVNQSLLGFVDVKLCPV